ncbi:DUF6053 domain-containing protein [Lysobacter enzymogenes]|uniref:DUF6053 domain-containing protein n=1 Tax=Lysobacter enzymogenes TaxID=69 RepID=UPI003D18E70C
MARSGRSGHFNPRRGPADDAGVRRGRGAIRLNAQSRLGTAAIGHKSIGPEGPPTKAGAVLS